MAKKQKKSKPAAVPTKHQLSKWQRQMRIRRIIIIAAAVFLASIMGWVGYGYYKDRQPFREIVIEVDDTSFDMRYYVTTLDAYTKGMELDQLYFMTDSVASQIVQDELIRQGAGSLGISVTDQEIDERIKENELPNDKVYQDIVRAGLLREKLLKDYFGLQLPDTMEQAHIQVLLVESREVADDVIAKIETDGNFTALADEFSCNPQIEGDLGWLPQELMPNTFIGDAVFSLEPGEVSQPIYDESATKSIGYWLIEVSDERDEEINVRAMLLGSKVEAEQVKAKLASENFTSVAQEYSQHGSKTEGGELGWLKQGDMGSEAFDTVAFNLTLNEVSEPVKDESVQTTGGYWIVQVADKGEHQISEDVRQRLASNDFADWFQGQSEISTINNYLDEEKKVWALDRVMEKRP